jgi:hypothetical protein
MTNLGVNKVAARSEWGPDSHVYQSTYAGSYVTMDELKIHVRNKDARSDFKWPHDQRKIGRYYFAKTRSGRNEQAPCFLSQSLYDSERVQSSTFASPEEADEEVELGTVRWTVFTPHYCMDIPGDDKFEFPYRTYFDPNAETRTQRKNPYLVKKEEGTVQHRDCSQRGVKVQIDYGGGRTDFFEDPEAWQPVLEKKDSSAHARTTPRDLKYIVYFDLPEAKLPKAGLPDAILLDSPVFDDITITYMRRPRVLQWREVSE